ncbi:carbohydrate kinase family protein [Vallitalea pronyensis]|uniref:Carbohydrate kinase family protein n=1 Tax=Vallitalea pronyensis TaxID=1348613 RepID=A0A8J8MFW0_9FIRM|nr:carbohydrate kinase family protein [Vallitalea pronyensis]QUI21032.1 carbohydrate kinase family protein [Vallitalea pronyensis]
MADIICCGIATVDIITEGIHRMPEDGKLELVESISMHTGGCAVNTAIDLAKMGEDVGIMALVGEDGMGDFLATQLNKAKVHTAGLKRCKTTGTSSSIVFVNDTGERSFLHTTGANGMFSDRHMDWEMLKKGKILFIGGALLMATFDGLQTAHVLKKAQDLGIYTVLDTAWDSTDRWMKSMAPVLPYLDLFIPSQEEAEMLSGLKNEQKMAAYFMEKGAKGVVIKQGKKGCYVKTNEESFYMPAYTVDAIDTTGAGDAFVSGFLSGLLQKWPIQKTAQFANAVGAHCVSKVGASSGIPSQEKILQFIKGREGQV